MKSLRTVASLVSAGMLLSAGSWTSTARADESGTGSPCPDTQTDQGQDGRAGADAKSTTTTTQAAYDPTTRDPVFTAAELPPRDEPAFSKVKPNRALLIAGGSMLLASYATTAIVGAVSPLAADEKLFVPVVGPWLNLAERPCSLGACGGKEDLTNAFILGGGITQAVGLGLAVLSLVVPEKRRAPTVTTASPTVRVTPISFGRGGGLGAVGTF